MAKKEFLSGASDSYLLLAGWSTVPCCHSQSWCDRRWWPGPSCALWWLSLHTRPSAPWWLLTTFLKMKTNVSCDYSQNENDNIKSALLVMWYSLAKLCCLLAHTCRICSWSGVIFSMDFIRLSKANRSKEKTFVNTLFQAFTQIFTNCLTAKQIPEIISPPRTVSWTRGTHPDVVLAQTLPDPIALGIDRYYHMVDSLRDRVLSLQVHPCGKVHYALGQFLHVKGMQCGWTNNHLEKKMGTI